MYAITILVSCLLVLGPAQVPAIDFGRVCIAPVLENQIERSAPGLLCDPAKLSLKIDEKPAMTWPTKAGIEIDLNVSATHRVVVFCNGKPQQSFKFRFAEFKSAKLCLFLNDLYRTVQLWESKRSPWCKCKDS